MVGGGGGGGNGGSEGVEGLKRESVWRLRRASGEVQGGVCAEG